MANRLTKIASALETKLETDTLSLWDRFVQDFRERFLTHETFEGLILLPLALFTIWVIFAVPHMIMHWGLTLACLYAAQKALRKIFVNRIKQDSVKDLLVDLRIKINEWLDLPWETDSTAKPKDTVPPMQSPAITNTATSPNHVG